MKQFNVTLEVTTTYNVEVHAEDEYDARDKAWNLDIDEIEAQGSVEPTETTAVAMANDIEEIQREDEEDE